MTTVDILKRAGVDPARDEKARRAVAAFRKLQPTLTSYARVLTGCKDVIVQMAARDNGSTDGKHIYFRPPMALGDATPHNRAACDAILPSGLPACPACAIRQEVLVTIYHEIAHIAFGTFVSIPDSDKVQAIEWAIKEAKGKYAAEITARIKGAPRHQLTWYGGLTSLINEHLPFLVNCLEDARVNAAMFAKRPGLRAMFYADTRKIFENGFEAKDAAGNIIIVPWNEQPLNAQAMIGVFCLASGYDVTGWFHPDIEEALADPELKRLCSGMEFIHNAREVFNLSFKVLARLRELGYCGTPQDPDPEPEPEPEQEEQQDDPTPDQDDTAEEPAEQPEDEGESDSGDPSDDSGEGSPGESDDPAEGEHASSESDAGEAEGEPRDSDESSAGADSEQEEVDEGTSQDSTDGSSDEVADSQEGPADDSSGTPHEGEADTGSQDESSDPTDEAESSSASRGSSDGDPDDQGEPDREGSVDGDEDSDSDDAEGEDDGDPDSGSESSESGDGGESGDVAESEANGSPDADGDQDGPGDGDDASDSDDSVAGTPAGGADGSTDSGTSPDQLPDEGPVPGGMDQGPDLDEGDHDGAEPGGQENPAAGDSGAEDAEAGDDDGDLIDTGADDGYGGTEIIEPEDKKPRPPMGEPEEIEPLIQAWGQHDEKPKSLAVEQEEDALDRAIVQGIYFTRPSQNVFGVREHRYDKPTSESLAWNGRRRRSGARVDEVDISETILQPAVTHTRRAFKDNERGEYERNRRRGRVDTRVLGRRAWDNDDRLFGRRLLPGRRDYVVIIGMDISGSTYGRNLALEKRAIYAQAEMLWRVGVPFAILAHTGDYYDRHDRYDDTMNLEVYYVKDVHEPWNDSTKHRLLTIQPQAANLDGHALEFLRKKADQCKATDKIILYYSDGKMPQENHDEELAILQTEIRVCRQKKITLLGVGIRTDSPVRHGLDTVQVDEDEDLVKVVQHLAKRLSDGR